MRRRSWIIAVLVMVTGGLLSVIPAASASTVNDNFPAVSASGGDGLRVLRYDPTANQLLTQDFVRGNWTRPRPVASPPGGQRVSGVGIATDPRAATTVDAAVAGGVVWVRRGDRAWSRIGTGAQGAPAVAGFGAGTFAVVARFGDTMRVRYLHGDRWGTWGSLGGSMATSPAAAASRDGRLLVVAADRNRHLYELSTRERARPGRWQAVGGETWLTPGLAVDPGDGSWHVVSVGSDRRAYEQILRASARTWSRPRLVGATFRSGVGLTARAAGRLVAVAVGADGRLTTVASVGGKWGRPVPVVPTVASPTVLPPGEITAVSGATITLAASAHPPAPGDVLVATTTPATPDGRLVKAVAVKHEAAGTWTVTTQPAKLTDAIPSADLDVPITLQAEDVVPTPGLRAQAQAQAAPPLIQAIAKNFSCSTGAQASISGSVSIDPGFRLTASWSLLGGVRSVSFVGTVTEDAELKASVSASGSCDLAETPLLAKPARFKPIVVTVGVVPIVITPQLQIYLDASGSAQAELATSVRQSAGFDAGLTYADGKVSPVTRLSNSFVYDPPTLTSSASITAGVAPKFSFLIYGVAGPRLDTRAHLSLSTAGNAWTLKAGLGAGAALVIPQLDIAYTKDDVLEFEKTIASGTFGNPAPSPSPPVPTTPPTSTPPTSTTKVIRADDGGPYASCGTDGRWSFALGGVGGTTGIGAPAFITAATTTGATVSVPLDHVQDETATYALATTSRLTGNATAVIDQNWSSDFFELETGPCTATKLTVTTNKATAKIGDKVIVSGRLTTTTGAPIAGQQLYVLWHSPSRDGKGQELDFTTAADGTFSTTVTIDEAGTHSFDGQFPGSSPTTTALAGSSASATTQAT